MSHKERSRIRKISQGIMHFCLILSLFWGLSNPQASRAKGDDSSSKMTNGAGQALSGIFAIVWGDRFDGITSERYTLTDDQGVTILLKLDESITRTLGGVLALNNRYVNVQGDWGGALNDQSSIATLAVTSITLAAPPQGEYLANADQGAVTGSKPWVSIMCKFSNISTEPHNLAFFQNMYGGTKPGLDHYWREVSYDTANVAGSTAAGWFTLPHPESYYNPSDTAGGTDLTLLANECIAAADSSVNFSLYTGINMMFNSDFDNGWAWGGTRYLSLDGVTKTWSTTWEPPWAYADISVIAHEMGHGFGLPHSSGNYGQTYDNVWDVMSKDRYHCPPADDPTYGCMAQHTIAYHKDKLGWIPAGQKYTAVPNASISLTLEQLALPVTGNYLMVQIPISGSSSHFYTVEARRLTGYDAKLPGAAVVIHEVDTTRSRPAYVIDVDGNGDTSDAGAMWSVGETFADAANGIYVTVNASTGTGFSITVTTSTCHTLTLSHTGSGGDPLASPVKSSVCSSTGQYTVGEPITLTASPATGSQVGSWSGTDDDLNTTINNSVVMPAADRTVTVNYVPVSLDDFVIMVNTSNPGSATNTFIIPTAGGGYNYNVDCDNDGINEDTAQTGNYTCTYADPGIYSVRISDNSGVGTGFPRIYFNDTGDKLKLVDIMQWGINHWVSMESAFFGCANLTIISATDKPDLSGVSSLSNMFKNAAGLVAVPAIDQWDTSNVTEMVGLFREAPVFNADLGGWDVSNVTSMHSMFHSAASFNSDLGSWQTGNVTTMTDMFHGAAAFDQNLGHWDVSSLTDAADMFNGVTLSTVNYDSLLKNWDRQILQPGVAFSGGNSKYCTGEYARTNMTTLDGWTITDGNKDCTGFTPTFGDVPFDYSVDLGGVTYYLYDYIQTLYDNGLTAGCQNDPVLLYCPDATLTRAESAVFMLRGRFGTPYEPPTGPTGYVFINDDWSSSAISWGRPWAEGLWDEGMTAGCQDDPLMFCPANQLPRVEGAVFGLRVKYGSDYVLPDVLHIFDPTEWESSAVSWGEAWAEQAYLEGLMVSCGSDPLQFCPDMLLDRAWAAYMIVMAKGLELP